MLNFSKKLTTSTKISAPAVKEKGNVCTKGNSRKEGEIFREDIIWKRLKDVSFSLAKRYKSSGHKHVSRCDDEMVGDSSKLQSIAKRLPQLMLHHCCHFSADKLLSKNRSTPRKWFSSRRHLVSCHVPHFFSTFGSPLSGTNILKIL